MKVISLFLAFLFFFSSHVLGQSEKRVSMYASVIEAEGKKIFVVSLKVVHGWHIYWKNPGDAGTPPKFSWFKGKRDIPLIPLEWPVPTKYEEGAGIVVYGYDGLIHFFFHFTKESLREFSKSLVQLKGQWLVCSNICIPGGDSLDLNFSRDLTLSRTGFFSDKELLDAFTNLPGDVKTPSDLEFSINRDSKGVLTLHFSLDANLIPLDHPKDQILYPFPHSLFGFGHEELFVAEGERIVGRFALDWNGEYLDNPRPFPKGGVFDPPLEVSFLFFHPQFKKREVIRASFAHFTRRDSPKNLVPFSWLEEPKSQEPLVVFFLLAFLGGLILNFMPCVLPVVSLKLFSLIRSDGATRRELLWHNLAYTVGILFSFLCLALTLILFKSAGQTVGWGFQLQSPYFVAVMIIFLLIFSLNLFGLFEFRLLGGKWLGGVGFQSGWFGDFISGVFATILSTPCSAPFLGTALAFAFSSSNSIIVLIFFSVGIGLSAPFLLTALFPRALALFPRPGKWMEDLRKFLGLTLLLTIVWLYDVLLSLDLGRENILLLNLILVTLFFAIYFHHRIGRRAWGKILLYFLPVALFLSLMGEKKI